jgi:hypothetical protein
LGDGLGDATGDALKIQQQGSAQPGFTNLISPPSLAKVCAINS